MILKIFLSVMLATFPGLARSVAVFNQVFNFSAAAIKGPIDNAGNPVIVGNRGIAYWQTVNNLQGSASACSYTLQGSDDGVTWNGVIIAATSCTTDGISMLTAISTASTYARINLTSFTGSSQNASVNIALVGYTTNN